MKEQLTIIKETKNPLFNRREFEINLESSVTPNIKEVEEILSKKFSTDTQNIKVKKVNGKFGSQNFIISANVYNSKEDKDKVERKTKKEKEAEAKAAAENKSGGEQ